MRLGGHGSRGGRLAAVTGFGCHAQRLAARVVRGDLAMQAEADPALATALLVPIAVAVGHSVAARPLRRLGTSPAPIGIFCTSCANSEPCGSISSWSDHRMVK